MGEKQKLNTTQVKTKHSVFYFFRLDEVSISKTSTLKFPFSIFIS